MSEWYYARGGQQSGPVTWEQLGEIARTGGLDPAKDLVWTASMKDWTPAGQVAGLFAAPATPSGTPAADPANPYAAPQSAWTAVTPPVTGDVPEIAPGSEPLDVVACVQRGFELTKRQFGTILLVGLVYCGMVMALSFVMGIIQIMGGAVSSHGAESAVSNGGAVGITLVSQVVSQVFSMYIGLGLTRIGLNLVSGKAVAVGMLFGEGGKLLRVIGATCLFGLVVGLGFLLLIVPGVYLSLRYGQYMVAIVDRDLGVMDAFAYSSALTTHNRGNIFLLMLLAMAIALAGLLACGVGLIFAGPVVWLSYMVAYRWMQYGRRATLDHPGTTTPVLSGV